MQFTARRSSPTNDLFSSAARSLAVNSHSISRVAQMRSPHRTIVTEPHREWAERVKARLDELCRLPHGWNGYGAPPVVFSSANFTLSMLQECCASNMATPSIVPGAYGDLQVEWHLASGDVELHVHAPYRVSAWRSVAQNDDGETVELINDFSVVSSWIRELSEASRAVEAATG